MTVRFLIWMVAASGYSIVLLASVAASLGPPQWGLSLRTDSTGVEEVGWVEQGSPGWDAGIQPGDRVLRAPSESTVAMAAGPGARIVVESAGSGRLIEAVAKRRDGFDYSTSSGLFAASWIYFVVGSLVYYRGPRHSTVNTFFLLCVAVAFALVVAPATANWLDWALVGESISLMWLTALFPLFFFVFPQQSFGRMQTRRLLFFGALVVAGTMTVLHVSMRSGRPSYDLDLRQLGLAYMALGAIAGVALIARSYFAIRTEAQREQLRLALFGGLVCSLPFVLLSLVPMTTGWYQPLPPTQTVLASVALPLSLAYAIMRHQLFGIRRLVHQGAVYGMLTAVTLGLYATAAVAGARLLPPGFTSSFFGQTMVLFLVLLAVTSYGSVRHLAERVIDTILYRDRYDYRQAIQTIGLQAALANNLSELGNRVLPMISDTVGIDFALVAVSENGHHSIRAQSGAVPAGIENLIQHGRHRNGLFEVSLPEDVGSVLCAHLLGGGSEDSMLCLGPKRNGEPFTPDDRLLLRTLANQFAVIIDKLRLLDELERQLAALKSASQLLEEQRADLKQLTRRLVEAQEAERSRIALYLHDEPLQRALLLNRAAQDQDLVRVATLARELASDLRNFSLRIHPTVLDDLGLASALEWLCDEVTGSAGFVVEIKIDGIDDAHRLSSSVELALFRIAQEALTNCQKHSRATRVVVELAAEDGQVVLAISDNGVGVRVAESSRGARNRRLGITGMRERAEALGGTLEVSGRQPRGTVVEATIPISQVAIDKEYK